MVAVTLVVDFCFVVSFFFAIDCFLVSVFQTFSLWNCKTWFKTRSGFFLSHLL